MIGITYLYNIRFFTPFDKRIEPRPETVCIIKNNANGVINAKCNSSEIPLLSKPNVISVIKFEVVGPAPNPVIPSRIERMSNPIDVFLLKFGV